ncbi:ABC transporter permease [Amnibacterium sp. CER49]|uniref:ABC transporter permease n=1 Tax=Amnibacterium sp. CER49 TaxID=3039161 RepID=UPI002448BDA6|nr:ABC transporter permease [Amnibacterium sp. CER49]MDH2442635.1 ABC transporter permease [Amnibacterium sp. CER49]
MTALDTTPLVAPGRPRRPSLVALGLERTRYELRSYFRAPDAVFFAFLFPTLIFVIFAAAFSASGTIGAGPDGRGGVTFPAYYLPGLVASGILLSGVQNLAIDIAGERSDGTLQRLGGTPLPVTAYLLGKVGTVVVTAVAQLVLLLAVAHLLFGVALPGTVALWGRFAWIFAASVVMSVALGVGMSGLPRSGRSATAVVVPILLVLQFISGVYFRFAELPGWLQTVAGIFPLKWVAQGMRSVFLPERFAVVEQTGTWDLGTAALVIAAWTLAGLGIALTTFRWVRKDR